jgi:hypothetical protein
MLVLQGWSDDTAWLHHHGIRNGELLRLDETSYYERILDELILINGEMDDMQREQLERAEALIATNQYGWTDVITNEAGDVLGEVIGLDYRGIPIYEGSYSLDAAGTSGITNLRTGGSSGLNIDGTGAEVAMWDVHLPRFNHQEFIRDGESRISSLYSHPTINKSHPTLIAGILGAAGINQEVRGMAPQVDIIHAASFRTDLGNMLSAFITNDYKISNHSYGNNLLGWAGLRKYEGNYEQVWYGDPTISEVEEYRFGLYNIISRCVDQIAYMAPHYLSVWAAGNERLDARLKGSRPWIPRHIVPVPGGYDLYETWRPADGNQGTGYDTLADKQSAKNNLVVGAVEKLLAPYSGPADVKLGYLSSFGPTDDGRIKPDLCAAGIDITCVGTATDTATLSGIDGTSLSSPVVAGGMVLIADLFKQRHQQRALSSTLRGLAIHTCHEAGTTPGPDYRFGWGLFNAEAATELIEANAQDESLPFLKEIYVTQGIVVEFPVTTSGTEPLKVTVCWTDPPGDMQPLALDPNNRTLIHDFDLRLIAADDTIHYPWVLDPAAPSQAALQADNDCDNVEQVCITNALPGANYTLQISHKGLLQDNQWLSICLSGIDRPVIASEQIERIATQPDQIELRWQAVPGGIYAVKQRTSLVDETLWSPLTGEISAARDEVGVQISGETLPINFYQVNRIR